MCVRASNCKVPVQITIQWNHSRLSNVSILLYVHLFLLKYVQLILQINIGLKNIKWYYTFGHSRMYRYTAYWQLARWAWGYLGEKIRVVLPSYDATRIRKTFPNESGYYIGFKPSHHNYVKYYLFCYLSIVSLSITINAQNFNNFLYKDTMWWY